MPGVIVPQNNKESGIQTAMQGLQAYGAIKGIQKNNAESDAADAQANLANVQANAANAQTYAAPSGISTVDYLKGAPSPAAIDRRIILLSPGGS